MAKTWEGKLNAAGLKFGIVVSRFNDFVTGRLLDGALDALRRHGAADDDISVAWVPGTFEIPLVASKLAKTNVDAVLCLGALIRGGTPHFDYLSAEVTKGVAQVGLNAGIPVIYGVITCDTIEQAIERAGTKAGNKGADAAVAGIEMANLLKDMGAGHP